MLTTRFVFAAARSRSDTAASASASCRPRSGGAQRAACMSAISAADCHKLHSRRWERARAGCGRGHLAPDALQLELVPPDALQTLGALTLRGRPLLLQLPAPDLCLRGGLLPELLGLGSYTNLAVGETVILLHPLSL